MGTEKIFQENNLQLIEDYDEVLEGRELILFEDYQLMCKQLKRKEVLAAYFVFQSEEDDLAIAINSPEQFDTVVAVVNKDKETMERYMQDSKYRSDIVFREVSFFAIDYLLN